MIEQVMTYVVLPVGGFVWLLHRNQTKHQTQITVLEKMFETINAQHDREINEIKETVKAIFKKLDSIEQELRK